MNIDQIVLDWKPRFDPKSLEYKIDKLKTTPTLKSRSWKRDLWLDQGQTSGCTGFGLTHTLGITPRRMPHLTNEFATERYHRAQQCDEWPGENYDGSSVLGAMKGAQQDKLIVSYHWATTIDEVLQTISHLGPMEIGINWYESMFTPDNNNVLSVTGKLAGGHAICIGGIDADKELVRLDNSWGKSWAVNGSAWLKFADLDRLLKEQGEFALPKKIKI